MRVVSFVRWTFAGLLALSFVGCDSGNGGGTGTDGGTDGGSGVDLSKPVNVNLDQPLPQSLSSFNFFKWDPATGFTFHEDVVPYELNSALFSDYALKDRAIYVPSGGQMTFQPELAFDLPVGSVIIKTFSFPADFRKPTENIQLVETRLLLHYADGWQGYAYIWNEAQTDAVLSPSGEVRMISFLDADGASQTAQYLIPQHNQCQSCHFLKPDPAGTPVIKPIGIKARHLDRNRDYGGGPVNQLQHMVDVGMLAGLPPLDTITPAYDFRPIEAGGVAAIPAADVEKAARDYLDINCAHCHNPNGVQGITSQLFLNHDNTDAFHYGVCKRPGSAGAGTGGFDFDIVPGDPATSILVFRTETTQVGAMMPLLGRSLTHKRGVELIDAWIAAMPPQACQ